MNRFSILVTLALGLALAGGTAAFFAADSAARQSIFNFQSEPEDEDIRVTRSPSDDDWQPRTLSEASRQQGRWTPRGGRAPGYQPPTYQGPSSWLNPNRSWFPRQRDAFPSEPWSFHLEATDPETGETNATLVCVDGAAECVPRPIAARVYSEAARYWLLRGDAELTTLELDCGDSFSSLIDFGCEQAGGRPLMPESREAAMRFWNRSVAWGRPFGAQSSILAQRRLQAHLVDCPVTQDSLARIARDPESRLADVIGLNLRQAALSALGYYNGSIDGTYGAETRRAVRAFQRELGYDETASLTPRQTAQLMCHAAQTARDPSVQNVLGIMHAVGLGVVQNTDLALEWLEMAAVRGDPDANFNLAVIYGTGAVFGSYRLCAIVENPERADAYLRDAAELGHGLARRFRSTPELTSAPNAHVRWARIREEIEEEAASEPGRGARAMEILRNAMRARVPPAHAGCLDANASR
ncbi:peptidoglycan-binding protein [Oceanicaulis alexandrii]|uniref:peptidoglycan-binding protein n=1 Tax=Oceanicaulis alexandrii TaxID=153233 RepID=UPI0035CEF52D